MLSVIMKSTKTPWIGSKQVRSFGGPCGQEEEEEERKQPFFSAEE